MKVIVAGSRIVTNPSAVAAAIVASKFAVTELVSGAAKGVDQLGERWAEENGIPVKRFPISSADWNEHGKRAGFIRNTAMAEYGEALVAVWDGESRGTELMIGIAKKKGLPVHIHLTY